MGLSGRSVNSQVCIPTAESMERVRLSQRDKRQMDRKREETEEGSGSHVRKRGKQQLCSSGSLDILNKKWKLVLQVNPSFLQGRRH